MSRREVDLGRRAQAETTAAGTLSGPWRGRPGAWADTLVELDRPGTVAALRCLNL
ncbi:MAG TPA: hypothetical protein VF317_02820 [Dermatophilaceae bacterium]|jgi:hypothetical protein